MIILKNTKLELSPNCGDVLVDPTVIVMHWTGATSLDGAVSWFRNPESKCSAHIVVGRDGEVVQCVSLNVRAWHAGVSEWKGRLNVNQFSVGIEMVNAGEVFSTPAKTKFKNSSGVVVTGDTVVQVGGQWYQAYTQSQWIALQGVLRDLKQLVPSLTEIVGHSDIAPGRKIDPGPAFPMRGARSFFEGRQ
jgi:N-acetylmuramoyl-L-alanine amidase